MSSMEILSPAGSWEGLVASVQNGADAVYLGCGAFNARRNAANFTEEELREAIRYCHLRGVRVYLTLNTLLYDRELDDAERMIRYADEVGVDALLVQDLGVLRLARKIAPELPLHASTQMTLHSLDGVRFAADQGMTRVVLSRELSRDRIAEICAKSPIEIEVFVHGALCMCYSGQCYFSSVIGGRSGNRGLCAQPCRMTYGWNGKADKPLLSLKDMSLAGHLLDLENIGVACAKIEGRMKRPEYAAIVTKVYASALKERREPTKEELEQLRAAFSRQGFTDGYYRGKTGPAMFGVRAENETDPGPLFAKVKKEYESGEHCRVPVDIHAELKADSPLIVTASDSDGHSVRIEGTVPEAARSRSTTADDLCRQLGKTGGTVYHASVTADAEDGLSVPVSSLNALRREALDRLSDLRVAPPQHKRFERTRAEKFPLKSTEPRFAVSVNDAAQITDELLALKPVRIELPLDLLRNTALLKRITAQTEAAVLMPRILWDNEVPAAEKLLRSAKECGVSLALCSTWSAAVMAKRLGFRIAGDFGLGITNSEAVDGLRALGFESATVSFELRLARIRDLNRSLPLEMLVYGRFPLMITENCIISNRTGGKCVHACDREKNIMTDRRRAGFPVMRAYGCRNEILNSRPLYLADKPDYSSLGMSLLRLRFTDERPAECVSVLHQYMGLDPADGEGYTRGLYYRDVE